MKYLFLVVPFAMLLAGCGKSATSVKTAAVSGTVSIGGRPADGVEVRFVTEKFEGYGKTNSDGKYELVAGAQPGKNKVFFSKMSGGPPAIKLDPEQGMDEGQLAAAASAGQKINEGQKQLIAADYSDREKSPITFEVPEGGTTSADFKLPEK